MKYATTRQTHSVNNNVNGIESSVWTNSDIDELMLGMLTTALDEIRDRRKSIAMQKEAKEWLMQDDEHSPFSALNCCRSLGLDLSRLRDLTNNLVDGGLYNE